MITTTHWLQRNVKRRGGCEKNRNFPLLKNHHEMRMARKCFLLRETQKCTKFEKVSKCFVSGKAKQDEKNDFRILKLALDILTSYLLVIINATLFKGGVKEIIIGKKFGLQHGNDIKKFPISKIFSDFCPGFLFLNDFFFSGRQYVKLGKNRLGFSPVQQKH